MFLQPKKTKYKKVQKGKLSKFNFRSNKLNFGNIGLKATKSGTISSRQIEAARQAIVRKLDRKGKLWIRVFPATPITAKPTEVRMGKGKGAVSHWSVKISSGTVLFEAYGIPQNVAISAFKTGGAKLPVKTVVLF
jgi:large subunit ribosomal protein L16|uniref:Ribosomal protein L16 n=1 Tax=Thalassiosira nordenskioeldii TaxID=83372 RepID=A0A891GQ60_THANO|nr:ribosomal protein L16 [Thalassiosira nordenskioeldii]QRK25904.1 ribosomal protein L16 [Thalassiosira nordenskioeldii]